MVSLAAKVAFLSGTAAYPEGTAAVEKRETHMSWVFLTDRYAYKLKKPVKTRFLDYATIAARLLNCRREIRLNRRLAPGIYLGVVPLCTDGGAGFRLGGRGRTVDWLVKMKRLPTERSLESQIESTTVLEGDVRRLGHRLSMFFRTAPRGRITAPVYLKETARSIRADRAELLNPSFGLPKEEIERLAASQLAFLSRHGDLLHARADAGRIREGHGDLRPEHVYCDGTPIVMDCLEFNRRLRLLDPVDELAYLAMECERLGDARIGAWLFDTYRKDTRDAPPDPLIGFYKCFRAYVRATIAIRHLADPAVREPGRWLERALQYLACAESHARTLDGISR